MHQTDVRPPSLNECSYRSHLSLLTIITCLGIYQVTCNATASNVKQFVVLRFDCGTANSPVKRGWIRVTHNTVYTRERGYGWLRAGSSSFDRTEVFIPRWLRESIAQKPQLDDMLRDGVFDKQDISFRADVPDGQYWVVVSIGDEGATRRNMSVYANGITIAENVTTQTSWGGFSTTRTFRKRIEVNNGKLELMFRHNGDGNSVLGIEVISFVPYPIWFANGRWHCSSVDENLRRGLEAMNKRAWQSARDSFARISEPLLRAVAFATLADILDVPEDEAHAFVERAIGLAEQLMRTTAPDSHDGILARELKRVCSNYLRARQFMRMLAYGHATKRTGFTFSRRLRMAEDWCQQITEYDPLFDRACLNIGRIHYWLWREGGSASEKQIADKWFGILKQRQPFNRLVRIYTGEQIPWGAEYIADVEGMPRWAVKQREAMGRLLEVVRWWIENRQLDNGEMGGGYGDDVEMLRQWHVFIGGSDDAVVKRGWLKLAHGVWNSGVIERGYSKTAWDVQHSAEPTADTQPAMIGLDYGNPVWVERCMETMKLMRDFWTGINARGHRHFKSAFIGATKMNTKPPWCVDVPCNGRATRPGLWVGWYNRNPTVVRLLREWMDAWVEDAMREENGKPAGVIPPAIAYETDKIGGYGKNWYEPNLNWSYFNWPGYTDKIYDHMLAVYDWTGDERYLKPIETAMELALEWKRKPVNNPPKGSRMWVARVLYGMMASTIEKYRLLTGRTKYDDYLRERGSPYMRFLLTGDKEALIAGCERAAASARFNFELKTSEVLFTDRIAVTQHPMWSMFTGGVSKPYFYPCYYVTWRNTGPHFAALVAKVNAQSLKVLVCNFERESKKVWMDLWRINPGIYELCIGRDVNGDDEMDILLDRRQFKVYERGTAVWLKLLPRTVHVVEVKRIGEPGFKCPFAERPDLAIGDQDVFVGKSPNEIEDIKGWSSENAPIEVRYNDAIPITVVVHNIGAKPTNSAIVRLRERRHGVWVTVDSAKAPPLEPPNDLDPKKCAVELTWHPRKLGEFELMVVVDPQPPQLEITRRNNYRILTVKVL